ncbi:MAG: hypothetical protein HWE26_12205 [Alteromonadaceae bacterium]|nr:hypothetical protein [Alteromonadaceae bacterium]
MTQHLSIPRKLIQYLPMLCLLCGSAGAMANSGSVQIIAEHELNLALAETSGLFCGEKGNFTINDSGNDPVIYQIDQQGAIIQQQTLSVQNRDWEAITGDEEHLYVGDFGNNRGNRKRFQIYKVAYQQLSEPSRIVFSYDNYDVKSNRIYEHDFDAEAMVAREDKLVLFSKSWQTKSLMVYHLDTNQSKQLLIKPVHKVTGIPGVITGADWDSANQQYVLVGYDTGLFGITHPFIATLKRSYELQHTYKLQGSAQVEGVCAKDNNEVWVTQEGSAVAKAKLTKLRLHLNKAD